MTTVVVGQTFHGTLAPAPVDKTPKKQPAFVTPNAAMTRSALLSVRRRVKFRLEVPRFVERSSGLAPDSPVRVHKITKGHNAVRLTFRTSAVEYWGIQQTDWNDAPVLAARASTSASGVVSTRSTTPGRTCTWSCCARTVPRTGS